MKRLLSIILLAAALAAAPAAGQTVKSLGYNTTNGNIVAATNVTFTNSVGFATNARAATRTNLELGATWLTNTNVTNFRTAIGLGATNAITFSNLATTGILTAQNATLGTATNAATAQGIQWSGLGGAQHAAIYGAYDGVAEISLSVGTTSNALSDVATFRATGMTVNSNAVVGGTLAVTGDTALSGVNNTMPNATTADSASSLMTRDLVGQEFANPRTKMQTTYWFGLEGLGSWQFLNSGATAMANRGPKFGPSLAFYSSSKPATTAAGAGVRLGANSITGVGAWRPIDGGAFTARSHVVNYYSSAAVGNRAFGFSFAGAANTNFWAAPDSFGLFWVEQPTNSWASNAVVAQHDRISVSNVVWAVSTTGTNGATEPTWTDLIGSLVTNGSAVYRNIGPHTSNNWVLAIGHTNASQVVMTNTGKSNWLRASGSGHEVLLTLRYGTNTTAPYTVYGSVADGTGQGSEVALNLATNTGSFSPQYWLRFEGTNTTTGNESAGMRYFSIDAETPPVN